MRLLNGNADVNAAMRDVYIFKKSKLISKTLRDIKHSVLMKRQLVHLSAKKEFVRKFRK